MAGYFRSSVVLRVNRFVYVTTDDITTDVRSDASSDGSANNGSANNGSANNDSANNGSANNGRADFDADGTNFIPYCYADFSTDVVADDIGTYPRPDIGDSGSNISTYPRPDSGSNSFILCNHR